MRHVAIAMLLAASTASADDGRTGVAYGIASAELTGAAVVAIHIGTSSSPGKGPGMALNFAPMIVGGGIGILAHVREWDPRAPLAVTGGIATGMAGFLIGSLVDGRHDDNGVKIGVMSAGLALAGAAGGAYFGATKIDTAPEAALLAVTPLITTFVGSIGGALAVFYKDDRRNDARLLSYTAGGLVVGLTATMIIAWPTRVADGPVTMPIPTITHDDHATVLSIGGTY